jgi:hypothetical protein
MLCTDTACWIGKNEGLKDDQTIEFPNEKVGIGITGRVGIMIV